MKHQKLLSVGFVSVLVVLASVSAAGLLAGTNSGALAQSNTGGESATNEPDDSRENATPLSFESTSVDGISEAVVGESDNLTNSTRVGSGDKEDWYSFDVEAGESIRAWGYGTGWEVGGALIGPNGTVLANLTLRNDKSPRGAVAENSGTYYIRMANVSTSTAIPVTYNFVVQVAEKSPLEPNDNRDSATPLTPGETVNTTLSTGHETDWYVVNASDGATIDATLRSLTYVAGGPEFDTHTSVDIFDSSGARVSEPADPEGLVNATNTTRPYEGTTSVTAVAESVETDKYYIRVTGRESEIVYDGFSPYSLTVETSNEPVDGVDEPSTETTTSPGTATTAEESTAEDPAETPTTAEPTAEQPTTEEPAETTEQPTTEEPTTEAPATEEPSQPTEGDSTDEDSAEQPDTSETAYYQVDFVAGEPIENLRGPNGTYSNDELIRFAHGSTDQPVLRRSDGEFTTDESVAERIESQNITVANGTATTTFTVAEGDSVTLTLASYEKIGPGWSPETEAQQEFVDSETRTFEAGTHTLTVELPGENGSDTE